MFLKYYGLLADPFRRLEANWDCLANEDLFMTAAQTEALNRLAYCADNLLFAVVFGLPGTGKTTVLRRLRERVTASKDLFLYVADSRLTPSSLYNNLLVQLGHSKVFYRGDAMRKVHQELDSRRSIDRLKIVLAVDEAHLLGKDAIEEIRFLLNNNMDSGNPLSLVLCGQHELWERLELRSSAAIKQRVDVVCRLAPFTKAETSDYIRYRLRMAGTERTIFTAEGMDQVYVSTSGIARLVDKLCSACLLHGFQKDSKLINEHMVDHISRNETL